MKNVSVQPNKAHTKYKKHFFIRNCKKLTMSDLNYRKMVKFVHFSKWAKLFILPKDAIGP